VFEAFDLRTKIRTIGQIADQHFRATSSGDNPIRNSFKFIRGPAEKEHLCAGLRKSDRRFRAKPAAGTRYERN
jgi:hypothetical protein